LLETFDILVLRKKPIVIDFSNLGKGFRSNKLHELSIAESLTDSILEAVKENCPGGQVQEVVLEVGEASGVVPEILQEVFPFVWLETGFRPVKLNIKKVPTRMKCQDCRKSFGSWPGIGCPHCSSPNVKVVRGRELRILSFEIEQKA
jgi:hydrogenase nickel incorporation protein HypA/HybF